MKVLMNKHHIDVMRELQELKKQMMLNFKEAAEQRQRIFNETKQKLDNVNNEVFNSRKEAQEAFEEAKLHRDEEFAKVNTNIGQLSDQMKERLNILDDSLSEAASHRDEIYAKTEVKFEATRQEVLRNREESNRNFEQARVDREKILDIDLKKFVEIQKMQEKTKAYCESEFNDARKVRQQHYIDIVNETNKVSDKVKALQEESNIKFAEAQRSIKVAFDKQKGEIETLRGEQREGFLAAMTDREEKNEHITNQIGELREHVATGFADASSQRQEIYAETEKQLQSVEQDILESRQSVEGLLEEASNERQELYVKTEEQIKRIEAEVLESRMLADARFDEAVGQRMELHADLADSVEQNRQGILQNREEAQRQFEEASAERDKIYAKTEEQIKEVNKNVNNLREECNTNFAEAAKHRESIYDQTEVRLDSLRSQIASVDSASVERLRELRESATQEKLDIESGYEDHIREILNSNSNKLIGKAKTDNYQASIIQKFNIFQSSDVYDEQLLLIDAAIDFAVDCAMQEGRKYDLVRDKFEVKKLLMYRIKLNLDNGMKEIINDMDTGQQELIKAYENVIKLRDSIGENNNSDYTDRIVNLDEQRLVILAENLQQKKIIETIKAEKDDLIGRIGEAKRDLAILAEALEGDNGQYDPEIELTGMSEQVTEFAQ